MFIYAVLLREKNGLKVRFFVIYSKLPECTEWQTISTTDHEDTWGIEEGFKQKKRQRSSLLFGGRIYSIPCRASHFTPGRFEE